jgi:hypothetical protein
MKDRKRREDMLRQDIGNFYRACERKDKQDISRFRAKWNALPEEFRLESLGKEIFDELVDKLKKFGKGKHKRQTEAEIIDKKPRRGGRIKSLEPCL